MTIALILVEIFTVIMQRNVCEKAFDRKPAGTAVQFMVWAAFYIISNVTTYFFELPSWLNMVIFSVTFFGVLTWLYEGSIRIKLVLVLFLCLIGMLSEVMVCFIGIVRHRYYTYDGKYRGRNHVYDFIKISLVC